MDLSKLSTEELMRMNQASSSSPVDLSSISTEDLMKMHSAQSPTTEQNVIASVPGRFVKGMKDPVDALAQLSIHALPSSIVNAVNNATRKVNEMPVIGPITQMLGMVPATPESIDKDISSGEKEYQQARQITGNTGADISRFAGNVVSPATIAISKLVPNGGKAVVRGAIAGGLGGLSQPITTEGNFPRNKIIQTGTGAITGAVMGPIIEKVGNSVTNFISEKFNNADDISSKVDEAIKNAFEENGQKIDDVPPDFIQSVKQEATNAIKEGRNLDPAAIIRQKDFESLGMKGTLGQVTRDATQFANERNLRGVPGGQPLMEQFSRQNQTLQNKVAQYGGNSAVEPQMAGSQITKSLYEADKNLSSKVGQAYNAARESAGRDLEIPVQNLNNELERIVKDYGPANIPQAIRSNLSKFGLFGEEAQKPFTMNDAEQIIQQANKLRTSDPAINRTLGEIKDAVKNAVSNVDVSGGPFAEARNLASSRFKLQDAIPALKAAAEGDLPEDSFVSKYLLNGQTKDVTTLADFLKRNDPASFNEARNQIGAQISKAAFGENISGDNAIAATRLSSFIKKMGTEKLKAFYTPEEIAQLRNIARVGGYIHNIPSDAPVNTSNTAGTIASLIQKVPGISTAFKLGASALQTVKNQRAVEEALRGSIPEIQRQLTPEETQFISQLVKRGSLASGQYIGSNNGR